MPRLSLEVALGVGAAGALVDVSSYARLTDGLSYRWGRTDQFYGAEPGVFSFVLDNEDGRFTPGNVASALDTTLTEGMAACVSVGGRLIAGTVRSIEPEFPSAEAAWSMVRVSCDDLLGRLARTRLLSVPDQLPDSAGTFGFWKFDEDAGSTAALDSGPLALPAFAEGAAFGYVPEFGEQALPWIGDTQAEGGGSPSSTAVNFDTGDFRSAFDYPSGSGGAYGFWFTPLVPSGDATIYFHLRAPLRGGNILLASIGASAGLTFSVESLPFPTASGPSPIALEVGVPAYISFEVDVQGSDLRVRSFVNGVEARTSSAALVGGSSAWDLSPQRLEMKMRSSLATTSYRVSRVSHTLVRVQEEFAVATPTSLSTLSFLGLVDPDVVYDIPSGLTDAQVSLANIAGDSSLDLLNDVLKAEQGHVHAVTTGTLTSPTEELVLRERDRPASVTAAFSVEDELTDAPKLIRDITNLISSLRVDTPDVRLLVQDDTLRTRAGGASDSERIITTDLIYSRAWGQDRIVRGSGRQMQIQSVIVDAFTTPTDRSADILGLVPGDRVQFTGLPSTQLGFTTWDGWFLGAEERHSIDEHAFELYFSPVIPDLGKYGTALYAAGGSLSLSAGIDSAVTSMSVATTSRQFTTSELPQTVVVGSEQMTVTAVSGATPQVFTVVRGVNGTTAASHSSGATVEIVPTFVYGF